MVKQKRSRSHTHKFTSHPHKHLIARVFSLVLWLASSLGSVSEVRLILFSVFLAVAATFFSSSCRPFSCMLTVEAVIILRNGPEQNETVASHYFMENRTKQLHHIILWRTERNSCVTLFYGTELVPTVL